LYLFFREIGRGEIEEESHSKEVMFYFLKVEVSVPFFFFQLLRLFLVSRVEKKYKKKGSFEVSLKRLSLGLEM
jgi:hypothetical protein